MSAVDRAVDSFGRCRIKDNTCSTSRPWLAYESPASVVSTPTPRCRDCGATAGLRTYLGTPLALKHPQWVCASGCKGGLK